MTSSFKHIAIPTTRTAIESIRRRAGYNPPIICTHDGVNMKLDPVISEIRAVREAYSEKFAGDIPGMLADLCARQREGGRKVVSLPAKRLNDSSESGANGKSRVTIIKG